MVAGGPEPGCGKAGQMPDRRKHRGPHPEDAELFDKRHWPNLQQATNDLSWLLSHDYSPVAALKLVGDRFSLTKRQRLAVMRSSCSDASLAGRREKEVPPSELAGQSIEIDGFNVLTTIEAAISGGMIIVGRDGCYRDIASVHGTFRLVNETQPALVLIGSCLCDLECLSVHWLLDSPVSNSGRLATSMREIAEKSGWHWSVELVTDADARLCTSNAIIATADSVVLDKCARWINLAKHVVDTSAPMAKIVSMCHPN